MRNSLLIPLFAALALCATGCEKEGPAESAGEQIDEAMDDVKEAADDAGDHLQEAGEEVKEAAEEAKDAVTGT
jgi:uncharacterized protein YjbJ (UPF0337 family)